MKSKTNKPKGTLTVIEFTPVRIKVMQAMVKEKCVVTHLISAGHGGGSEREIADAVAGAFKTHRLTVERCIVSLDRSYVSLRLIKLPTTNEGEIKDMVRWQAAKSLPYTIDEIVVSHRIIKSDDEGFSHVLVAIIPHRSIEKYVRICDSLKLDVPTFAITSEGLLNWYLRQQPGASCDEACALIDIEDKRFEAVVIYQDKFIFSRSFSLSSAEDTQQRKEKILEDVKVSLESYRKQEACPPIKQMVLVGETSHIADLAAPCSQELNITPRVLGHLDAVDMHKDAVYSSAGEAVSFAAGCGWLLSATPAHINLIPPSVQQRLLYTAKKRELLRTLALAAGALMLCVAAIGFHFYNKNKILGRLDAALALVSPAAREIQEIKDKMAVISAQLNNERSCLEILRELHAITPAEISLYTFIFEDEKVVVLKGSAPAMSLVFTFVPLLNQSPFFENVEVRYATQRKTQSEELTDFEIACPLHKQAHH